MVHVFLLTYNILFTCIYRLDKGYVMACNYSPKGNVVGKPVNRLGDPCTHCELDRPSCSGIFRGLCGLGNLLPVAVFG